MSDFNWAVKKMKDRKKVRIQNWTHNTFIYNKNGAILNDIGKNFEMFIEFIEATDWELFEEETSSEFLIRAGMDGKKWSEEFIRLFGNKKEKIDESLMTGWFSNSIMAGYDRGVQSNKEKPRVIENLELLSVSLVPDPLPGQEINICGKIKEETLSDRIYHFGLESPFAYGIRDIYVRQFIKKRIDDLHDINNGKLYIAEALAKLKLEAGDGLI